LRKKCRKPHPTTIDTQESISDYLERQISQLLPVDEECIVEDIESKRRLYLSLQASQEPHIVKKTDINESEKAKLAREIEEIETIERIVDSIEKSTNPQEPMPKLPEPDALESELPELRKNDVTIVKELEENRRLMDDIDVGQKKEKPKNFILPKLEFLEASKQAAKVVNEAEVDAKIEDLLEKLKMFKIEGDVVRTYSGPVVTTFEFKPAPHIKVSKILNLQDDIAMALKALTIRIQAPIPGKDVVGIEIPNDTVETIYLRDVLASDIFNNASSPLTIALGKDIVGNPFITDLKKLPHLLIAGTTGSGKSVGINAMILSLLYRNSPDDLKLLMVDPKMLEFSIYNDIPHLLTPVITKPKQAIAALANMVREMERRYYLMSQTRTKNIENYNDKAKEEGFAPIPYIVVVIDELADLMMTGGKEVEVSIARLAQMARASGIHLIVATQRPSVDVITGLIKANLPSRISYRVGQKIDSKVILDTMGAESLLGRGDMLFTPPGSVGLVRLHAPWSSEKEIEKIVEFLKSQRKAEYDHSFLSDAEGGSASASGSSSEFDDELDELYDEAREIVFAENKTSISYLQRRLQIGYNRAARIVEQLEKTGVLSEQNSKGQREIIG
jgi:S-DNA-T family DNA segregation ATPase FtsK/SpoIIIE